MCRRARRRLKNCKSQLGAARRRSKQGNERCVGAAVPGGGSGNCSRAPFHIWPPSCVFVRPLARMTMISNDTLSLSLLLRSQLAFLTIRTGASALNKQSRTPSFYQRKQSLTTVERPFAKSFFKLTSPIKSTETLFPTNALLSFNRDIDALIASKMQQFHSTTIE